MNQNTVESSPVADANWYILMLSILGFLVAVYSYYVKWNVKQNASYKAICDLSDSVSCSRVLTSQYGQGFGIIGKIFGDQSVLNMSNSILGSIFYLLQIVLTFQNEHEPVRLLALATSIVAILGCFYLAYILYFVLRDFCLVCNASYAINAFILYFNWSVYSHYKQSTFV